ncbi:helix-turn-helix transcriptional regulator [Lactobacillus hamsteri]|uniref:HTH cro/C1-type domain-containing protein n=1 Tax=Lactobacillus hamsteri DSM 5661 = JCM 6256 TaxID=1423754 RepID=A0A0R1YCR4_9LACO|nr:helix-turn-helix domain-containing protein [Lactobacillus hamsteri]KRM40360.1 hypothetical protein FC39_GL000684 [Lactobacillus hamsteri DSM 5661 = JCM 6256]
MTIGEALKSFRLQLGLTQTDMAANLVSESFYSKVERGVHKIDADLLIQVLNAHGIPVISFFQLVDHDNKIKDSTSVGLSQRMIVAVNNKDIAELRKIKKQLEAVDVPEYLKHNFESSYAWATHSNQEITAERKNKIKKAFIKTEWNEKSYGALAFNLVLLDIDDAYQLVNLAYSAFKKSDNFDGRDNGRDQNLVSLIAVNFLNCCYHKKADIKYTKSSIDMLYTIPLEPTNLFGRIFATYYDALFKNDKEMVDAVLKVLRKSGAISLIQDTIGK